MKVKFYKKMKLEEKRELILEKELPLDEISIYSSLLKEKIEKKEEERFVIMTKNKLNENNDEVTKEVLIRPIDLKR